jgi:hypothetical protein
MLTKLNKIQVAKTRTRLNVQNLTKEILHPSRWAVLHPGMRTPLFTNVEYNQSIEKRKKIKIKKYNGKYK